MLCLVLLYYEHWCVSTMLATMLFHLMMRIVEVLYERTELELNNNYRVTHAAVL